MFGMFNLTKGRGVLFVKLSNIVSINYDENDGTYLMKLENETKYKLSTNKTELRKILKVAEKNV